MPIPPIPGTVFFPAPIPVETYVTQLQVCIWLGLPGACDFVAQVDAFFVCPNLVLTAEAMAFSTPFPMGFTPTDLALLDHFVDICKAEDGPTPFPDPLPDPEPDPDPEVSDRTKRLRAFLKRGIKSHYRS